MTEFRRIQPGRARFVTTGDLHGLCRPDVRREILAYLARGPIDVGALADRLDLAFTTVSDHLQHLQEACMAEYTRDGHKHVYRLGPAVRVERNGGGLALFLSADDGGTVMTTYTPEMLRQLERRPPGNGEPCSGCPRGGAGPGAPGGAPAPDRPPSGRGSP